jgi:RimJ/RimL family protein N-acetyltransferase
MTEKISVNLRKVRKTDWDKIYKIRNDEHIRKFMFNSKPIELNEHYQYLTKQEKNQNFFNWMILFGDIEVGYVRILNYDVSIMIKKEFQGKGIGVNALYLLEDEARKVGIEKLEAKIIEGNHFSESIFLKNKFIKKGLIFEKSL